MSLTKRVFKLQRRLEDDERELTRDINMVDQTMNNRIHHFSQELHRRIDESVTQSKSYTDHRIDKLVDVYFDVKSAKKSVLKD
jgi:hypothetical protein